jgi:hypothetical protein
MIISPWFSTESTQSTQPAIYHHNTACRTGKAVKKNCRRYGTDNRELCKACAKLDGMGR